MRHNQPKGMRQAIVTKYLGPTNTRGSRISVRAQAGRRIYAWDDGLDVDENHTVAAHRFANTMGWSTRLVGGAMPDNTGYVFVMI
jgi:hypothetical protein